MDKLFIKLADDLNKGIRVLKLIWLIEMAMEDSLGNSKGINTKLQSIDSTQEISVAYREYLAELLGYSDDQLVELDNYIELYYDSISSTVELIKLLLDNLKEEDRSLVIDTLMDYGSVQRYHLI